MDPISDMFSQIMNALKVGQAETTILDSRFKKTILDALKQEGYIENYQKEKRENKDFLKIKLRYLNQKPVIKKIRRVSKPGLRVYVPANKIPRSLQGFGTIILSTNQGIITGSTARRRKIGGEFVCEIY